MTIVLSSASDPQISLAQDMLRGPYGTDARWRKKENHFRPEGMFQIARQRAAKPPRSVLIDIIRARCRIASEMMANDTVKTSWMAELPVGMMFLEESVYDHPWSKCTYNLGHRKSFSFEPKRERVDAARRTNVDKDDVQYGQEIDVPATCVVNELRFLLRTSIRSLTEDSTERGQGKLLSRGSTNTFHSLLRQRTILIVFSLQFRNRVEGSLRCHSDRMRECFREGLEARRSLQGKWEH